MIVNKRTFWVSLSCYLPILLVIIFFAIDGADLMNNLEEELLGVLNNIALLIPAILGLWKFRKGRIGTLTFVGFVIYGVLMVAGYLNVFLADDALAAGLPMVVIVLPYIIIFSGYLIVRLLLRTL